MINRPSTCVLQELKYLCNLCGTPGSTALLPVLCHLQGFIYSCVPAHRQSSSCEGLPSQLLFLTTAGQTSQGATQSSTAPLTPLFLPLSPQGFPTSLHLGTAQSLSLSFHCWLILWFTNKISFLLERELKERELHIQTAPVPPHILSQRQCRLSADWLHHSPLVPKPHG